VCGIGHGVRALQNGVLRRLVLISAAAATAVLVLLATGTSTDRRDERTQHARGGGVRAPAAPRPPRLSPLAAARCDRVAAPWGSKHGDGSPSRPVRGPAGLVRLLVPGQTGCLRAGTYTQPELIVKRERITLRSAPGERATWRGRIVLRGRGERLLELNLDGSYGPSCGGSRCGTLPSPTIHGADVVVAFNDIASPNSGICVHPRAWHDQRPDKFRIVGNRIHNCGRMPPTEHDHGIYVADGTGGEIRGNVVFDNADRGIQLFPDARFTTVVHNTVDGNGSGIVLSERSAGNTVRDNLFTNSLVRWNAETFRLTGRGNRFAANCVRPGNRDPEYNANGGVALPRRVSQSANRIARDPVYEGRDTGDFRVLPGSACAGKGAPDSVALGRPG
jgi:parallel beta-helix repeat protein